MSTNLFEKYGIKEVADVTFYKIERKNEEFESSRKITASSILRDALSVQTVYPISTEKDSCNKGIKAYVFDRANVLTHYNYDCDDTKTIYGIGKVIDTNNDGSTPPIFDIDDTESEDYVINFYNNSENQYENLQNAYKGEYLDFVTGYDNEHGGEVVGKISKWINDTDDFSIDNFSMSDISLLNANNYKLDFNSSKSIYSDSEVTIIAELNEEESEKDSGLPDQIKITVDLEDVENWVVIYSKIKDYLLALDPSIDMDVTDLYGIYSTYKVDTEEDSGTDLNFISGTITFSYFDTEIDSIYPINVVILIPEEEADPYYTVNIPKTVAYDLINGTNISSKEEKIKAIKAFAEGSFATLKYTTIDGNETSVDIDYEETDLFSNISFELELFPYPIYQFKYKMTIKSLKESETGIYDSAEEDPDGFGHYSADEEYIGKGSHEFNYYDQICMLYAKDQDLINANGTRYHFKKAKNLFNGISFNDNYSLTPSGTERVVVCGLSGRTSDNCYDIEEVKEYIKNHLNKNFSAKAYDVSYSDYAELSVEDEMGYYMPEQLGIFDNNNSSVEFFNDSFTYKDYATSHYGVDLGILNATDTWGNDIHYSINDAIDALKQELTIVDGDSHYVTNKFKDFFGGYKVKGKDADKDSQIHADGTIGRPYSDTDSFYGYYVNGSPVKNAFTGEPMYSGYSLDDVIGAINEMESYVEEAEVRVSNDVMQQSNRAIYIDNSVYNHSAAAHIYLLSNMNANLRKDDKGIFIFTDKTGNEICYQDKIFCGHKFLALVVIGRSGLIFSVNRHSKCTTEKTCWMMEDSGKYPTATQLNRIISRGLIHTVTITCGNQSFDATCTVSRIKVHKTKKNTFHYTPVLFLDTLKISTIDQESDTTDATGGKGNAKLITWDYGKNLTLSIEDALFSPASMGMIWGADRKAEAEKNKETKMIDRFEKVKSARNFIVPTGNEKGTPVEGELTPKAVYYDPDTMKPYPDGTPIVEGQLFYKFTRSIAKENKSIGNTIEVSAEGFPGVYRVVGETYIRDQKTGEDQRFQFIISEAKMTADDTSITLEADGDPVVFDFSMVALRPEDGIMMKLIQYDTEDNLEENDGSTMVKDTELLKRLDDAEVYQMEEIPKSETSIGETEY